MKLPNTTPCLQATEGTVACASSNKRFFYRQWRWCNDTDWCVVLAHLHESLSVAPGSASLGFHEQLVAHAHHSHPVLSQ